MCRENHFTKCIYPFPAPELHIFAIVKPLTWSEKGKHWCCCACTHHSSYIVFFDTCGPCSSYILKSIRIGALFVNCPDDNQQIILLSYYFSKSFVLVSRWTPQGCILSGLIVLVSDCTTDLHCIFLSRAISLWVHVLTIWPLTKISIIWLLAEVDGRNFSCWRPKYHYCDPCGPDVDRLWLNISL